MDDPSTITVLVVDDDDVDLMSLRRAFRRAQVRNAIRTARDGVEALAILRGQSDEPLAPPFVVLLDLNMPRMGGLEVLRELRGDRDLHGTPVFVLSTSSSNDDIHAAYDLHAAGYIVKSAPRRGYDEIVEMLGEYCRVVELPQA